MSESVREAGWYWVCRVYETSELVPALWQPEYKSWKSATFGGIPDSEVAVIERLTPPLPHFQSATTKRG